MNYYKILDVDQSASIAEIKAAYHRLALKYHPDRNPDNQKIAEEKFKLIAQAYEILGNAEKRRKYDRNALADMENHYNRSEYLLELLLSKTSGLIISISLMILFILYLTIPILNAIVNGLIFALIFYTITSECFIDKKMYNKKECMVLKAIFGFLAFILMSTTIYFLKDTPMKGRLQHFPILRSSKRTNARSITTRSLPRIK